MHVRARVDYVPTPCNRRWETGSGRWGREKNRTPSPPVASAIATSPPRNYLVLVVYRWSIDRPSDIALLLSPRVLSCARLISPFCPSFAPVLSVCFISFFPPSPRIYLSPSFLDDAYDADFSRLTRKSRLGLLMLRRAVFLVNLARDGF